MRGYDGGEGADLEVGPLGAADVELELVFRVGDDGGLDGHKEVLLFAGVLQDDGEGVVDVAVDAAVGAEEAGHGGGAAEEHEGLVEGVRAWGRR